MNNLVIFHLIKFIDDFVIRIICESFLKGLAAHPSRALWSEQCHNPSIYFFLFKAGKQLYE